MMHEGEFKEIVGLYKQLRKEGVIFPQRDASEAFMIKFTGTKSPIFQTMEENRMYEDPIKQLNPNKMFKVNDDYFSSPEYNTNQNYAGGGNDTNYQAPQEYVQSRNSQQAREQEDALAEYGDTSLSGEEVNFY